jgi:hypothetical protein
MLKMPTWVAVDAFVFRLTNLGLPTRINVPLRRLCTSIRLLVTLLDDLVLFRPCVPAVDNLSLCRPGIPISSISAVLARSNQFGAALWMKMITWFQVPALSTLQHRQIQRHTMIKLWIERRRPRSLEHFLLPQLYHQHATLRSAMVEATPAPIYLTVLVCACAQLGLYMSLAPEQKLTFPLGGPAAQAAFEQGLAGFEARAFRGLGVLTSTPYEMSDDQDSVQMLQRSTQVGEFYRMAPPEVFDPAGLTPQYMGALRSAVCVLPLAPDKCL